MEFQPVTSTVVNQINTSSRASTEIRPKSLDIGQPSEQR
jgi:hypothetical protein